MQYEKKYTHEYEMEKPISLYGYGSKLGTKIMDG